MRVGAALGVRSSLGVRATGRILPGVALVARLAVVAAGARDAGSDPLLQLFDRELHQDSPPPSQEPIGHSSSVPVRVSGVAPRLRLGAVRHFVPGVTVALTRDAVDAVRRDALLQLLDTQLFPVRVLRTADTAAGPGRLSPPLTIRSSRARVPLGHQVRLAPRGGEGYRDNPL